VQGNNKAAVLCDTESQVVSFQDFAFHVVLYPLTHIDHSGKLPLAQLRTSVYQEL
jgi:hypothetical protein